MARATSRRATCGGAGERGGIRAQNRGEAEYRLPDRARRNPAIGEDTGIVGARVRDYDRRSHRARRKQAKRAVVGGLDRINAIAPEVPRRSTAILNDGRPHGCRVLSHVSEVPILLRGPIRDRNAIYTLHRTVRVRIDGESQSRRIEYSRLVEFAAFASAEEKGIEA